MATAKKILLYVLLISATCIGCKNNNSNNNKHDRQFSALRKQWYKRYTGTVAGQPVVVNLQCSRGSIKGSYYYIDKGVVIDLLPYGHVTNDDTSALVFNENNPIERAKENDSTGRDSWQLSIYDSIVSGKWLSGDGKRHGDINLKEDYSNGAYPLDVLVKGDSIMERKNAMHVSAVSLYDLIQPPLKMNTADADFLKTTILHFLGGEFADVKNINDYILQGDKKYFENFEKLLADINIDRRSHENWEYNFDHTRLLKILYNNNGMMVLQLAESDRTGGGIMGSHFKNRYANIDMEQKKVWQLKDMMEVDASKLTPLLDEEVHGVFGIPKGPLTGRLRVDAIPLTENVYITHTGITFCYYPGVIAPEDDGEICLFLSYAKLKNWLKENFKARMQL